jgi:uncharacterized membrane protein YdjX (TVP38/TMEM64 family)
LLLFFIAFLIAIVPAIPYGLLAALLGAKYGLVPGSIINLTLSSLAAITMFILVRYTFNPEQRRQASDLRWLSRLTALFERSPFLAVMFARMLPFIPAQAINVLAAVTRMNLVLFAVATILGKIPFMVAATMLGERILKFDTF